MSLFPAGLLRAFKIEMCSVNLQMKIEQFPQMYLSTDFFLRLHLLIS